MEPDTYTEQEKAASQRHAAALFRRKVKIVVSCSGLDASMDLEKFRTMAHIVFW